MPDRSIRVAELCLKMCGVTRDALARCTATVYARRSPGWASQGIASCYWGRPQHHVNCAPRKAAQTSRPGDQSRPRLDRASAVRVGGVGARSTEAIARIRFRAAAASDPRDDHRCHTNLFDAPEVQARLSITWWSPASRTWPGFRMPLLEVHMTEVVETTTTRRRRRQTARNTSARASSLTRRGRSARQTTEQVLADLDRVVSALIKENRELSRQVERFSGRAVGAASGTVERTLRSIQRRVSGAVDGGITTGRRKSAGRPVARKRGRITDPELLERRRQALAKAREARSAKRASAS
jgi:hypothetical protein